MSGGVMIEVKCADCYEFLGGVPDTADANVHAVLVEARMYRDGHVCGA